MTHIIKWLLKILNKIKALFGKRKMEIDNIINEWFEESTNKLKALNLPKNNINELISTSFPLIDNYFSSTLLILNHGSKLPAMALLRVSGEFIAKLIYCLQGNGNNINERIKSWRKTSLLERKRPLEKIVNLYNGCEQEMIEGYINKITKKIDEHKLNNKVEVLPKIEDIFKKTFKEKIPFAHFGMYLQYLPASHIDLETLAETIRPDGTPMGDVQLDEYNIKDLKFDCLALVYVFFENIYKHYNLDFQKIENEYKIRINDGKG